jgi:hypothetical protein
VPRQRRLDAGAAGSSDMNEDEFKMMQHHVVARSFREEARRESKPKSNLANAAS